MLLLWLSVNAVSCRAAENVGVDTACLCMNVQVGRTGVEMEALTAVSVAALTVYDMCKAVSKDIVISDIQLDSKRGGKSGDYAR